MEHTSLREKADELQKNDRVAVELEDCSLEGTVCKSNRGGIRVLPEGGDRLYVIKTSGAVSSTHPDGGALRTDRAVGRAESVEAVGSGSVEYDQREGWVHA